MHGNAPYLSSGFTAVFSVATANFWVLSACVGLVLATWLVNYWYTRKGGPNQGGVNVRQ